MGTSPSGRSSLNGELFRQVRSARLFVSAAVALGILSAAATVAQMIFLSQIIDRVYLKGVSLADVHGLLLLLLGAILARAALLWTREVVAGRGPCG
jgi:ATP-binding cassette subfamily C protein CydD